MPCFQTATVLAWSLNPGDFANLPHPQSAAKCRLSDFLAPTASVHHATVVLNEAACQPSSRRTQLCSFLAIVPTNSPGLRRYQVTVPIHVQKASPHGGSKSIHTAFSGTLAEDKEDAGHDSKSSKTGGGTGPSAASAQSAHVKESDGDDETPTPEQVEAPDGSSLKRSNQTPITTSRVEAPDGSSLRRSNQMGEEEFKELLKASPKELYKKVEKEPLILNVGDVNSKIMALRSDIQGSKASKRFGAVLTWTKLGESAGKNACDGVAMAELAVGVGRGALDTSAAAANHIPFVGVVLGGASTVKVASELVKARNTLKQLQADGVEGPFKELMVCLVKKKGYERNIGFITTAMSGSAAVLAVSGAGAPAAPFVGAASTLVSLATKLKLRHMCKSLEEADKAGGIDKLEWADVIDEGTQAASGAVKALKDAGEAPFKAACEFTPTEKNVKSAAKLWKLRMKLTENESLDVLSDFLDLA